MGKVNIHGAEYPIQKIFNDDFVFTIPQYQRPYAWTTEQAEELLDDLISFVGNGKVTIDDLPPYFLGSIVLIKGDEPKSEVIDGQQRLTTLTILLSILRTLMQPKYANALTSYLYQEADLIANIPNRYRLEIRERDKYFFQEYIQNEGGIKKLVILDPANLSDSRRNIRDNGLLFLNRLRDIPERELILLAQAIINRCFLVVVSTPNFDSAYRIFSVLNDRGLNLSHADILKAQIIGEIPQQEQTKYTEKWEDIEEDLGRETFQSLFAHIRMIYRKAKLQDTVLEEFRDYVWPTRVPQHAISSQRFIDETLLPYAEAFSTIKNTCYQSVNLAEKINHFFKWLNKIENSDWLPPAILFYSLNQNDPAAMLHFFIDLERLAVGLMIQGANVNKRIERYSRVLTAIENGDDLYSTASPLQLTYQEQKAILESLNGNLYESWFCKYVLLRLDEFISGSEASYNYPIITIEHVLPQTPKTDSIWMTLFPRENEREHYVHRLGNLVLLSRKKNSEAQNFDFETKKRKYFLTASGASPFALTTQLINVNQWTPSIIEQRQQYLVNKLRDIWRLN